MTLRTVNIFRAKSDLSRLVEAVESGAEAEIMIARNGRPVARLVPVKKPLSGPRIGVAKAAFDIPPGDGKLDALIGELFAGHASRPSHKRARPVTGRKK